MMNPMPGADFAKWRYTSLSQDIEANQRRFHMLELIETERSEKQAKARHPWIRVPIHLKVGSLVVSIGAKLKHLHRTPRRQGREIAMAERLLAVQSESATLDFRTVMSAPAVTRIADVVGAMGTCPGGFRIGDSLIISAKGELSAPICSAAIAALEPLTRDTSSEAGFSPRVSCVCPLGERHLTFAVRPAEPIATS